MFQYMKRHLLLVSVLTVASVGLTSSAQAGNLAGADGPRSDDTCICFTDQAGAAFCGHDASCAGLPTCGAGDPPCAAGTRCAVDSCCSPADVCVPDPCPNKPCLTPGVCLSYEFCTDSIPTLPEWGFAALMLLVLTAGTVVFGRRRRAAA